MENKPTERIQATHFIEQYSNKKGDTIKEKGVVTTAPLNISNLNDSLSDTAKYRTIHTVAIFKIKYK